MSGDAKGHKRAAKGTVLLGKIDGRENTGHHFGTGRKDSLVNNMYVHVDTITGDYTATGNN